MEIGKFNTVFKYRAKGYERLGKWLIKCKALFNRL